MWTLILFNRIIVYFRHSTPRGKKTGPENTHANSCTTYVSFQYITEPHPVAVVRKRLEHTGHDPSNLLQAKVNPVDPNLRLYIEYLLKSVRIWNSVYIELYINNNHLKPCINL